MTIATINDLDDEEYRYIFTKVSENTRQRANACLNTRKAKSIIMGEYLARCEISRYLKIPFEKVNIQKSSSSNNKLVVLGFSTCHFSYSHSGDYILIAVADQPIGCDIQVFKKIKIIADTFFTKADTKYILDSAEYEKALAEIWSLKESYFKYTGTGWMYTDVSFSCHKSRESLGIMIYSKEFNSSYMAVCVERKDDFKWNIWNI